VKDETNLVRVLSGEPVWPPPIWLMRQAGRYLPEYRELRAKAGSFWAMCNSPELASEITLQPVRRFGFDAAIIFSDILTIPVALGCPVEFEAGEGPRLAPISNSNVFDDDRDHWAESLAPAYETLKRVRRVLGPETTLIGFAGAPWTLATYLAAGRGRDEQKAAKLWGYREPESFARLLDALAECVSFHLIKQIEAGADVVQIFDSWASGVPANVFLQWIVEPTRKIVSQIRAKHPKARIIGFPRASTLSGYELYARETGVDAVSFDPASPLRWARDTLSDRIALQGNLDPIALIAGGKALDESVDEILTVMRGRRFIFNLGHGILQETPIENVSRLVARVRSAA
jgi:uroporphyrinogen decarboxylase